MSGNDNSKNDLLIETSLLSQICAFHDLDDKEKREKYAKEYFDEFCKKTGINPEYALSKLENYLKFKRANTQFKYEHYRNLRGILGLDREEKDI